MVVNVKPKYWSVCREVPKKVNEDPHQLDYTWQKWQKKVKKKNNALAMTF